MALQATHIIKIRLRQELPDAQRVQVVFVDTKEIRDISVKRQHKQGIHQPSKQSFALRLFHRRRTSKNNNQKRQTVPSVEQMVMTSCWPTSRRSQAHGNSPRLSLSRRTPPPQIYKQNIAEQSKKRNTWRHYTSDGLRETDNMLTNRGRLSPLSQAPQRQNTHRSVETKSPDASRTLEGTSSRAASFWHARFSSCLTLVCRR